MAHGVLVIDFHEHKQFYTLNWSSQPQHTTCVYSSYVEDYYNQKQALASTEALRTAVTLSPLFA